MEELPLEDAVRLSPYCATLYYGMRLLPSIRVRKLISRVLATWIRTLRGGGLDAVLPPATLNVARSLRGEGLAMLPPLLSPAQIDDILAFLHDKPLVGKDGRRFAHHQPPSGARLGSYPLSTVLQCPHVVELMNHPEPLQIAAAYLGCAPTISGLRIDWSGPSSDAPIHVQHFHRDYDDWRFAKLFVYLTEVDEGAGPHEYVTRSHVDSGRFRIRPYDPGQLDRKYGRERRVRVCGPAGTTFMADTWGVHRGNVPTRKPRLLLQIQYSLLPVLKFAYRPQPIPLAARFDRYINRLLFAPQGAALAHLGEVARE